MILRLFILLFLSGVVIGDDGFRILWKQPIVTRPPAEFIRYYAANIWLKHQKYDGFAKVSQIWPGTESPLAEAAAKCEQLMCEEL